MEGYRCYQGHEWTHSVTVLLKETANLMRYAFTQCVLMISFGKSIAFLDLFGLGVLLKRETQSSDRDSLMYAVTNSVHFLYKRTRGHKTRYRNLKFRYFCCKHTCWTTMQIFNQSHTFSLWLSKWPDYMEKVCTEVSSYEAQFTNLDELEFWQLWLFL